MHYQLINKMVKCSSCDHHRAKKCCTHCGLKYCLSTECLVAFCISHDIGIGPGGGSEEELEPMELEEEKEEERHQKYKYPPPTEMPEVIHARGRKRIITKKDREELLRITQMRKMGEQEQQKSPTTLALEQLSDEQFQQAMAIVIVNRLEQDTTRLPLDLLKLCFASRHIRESFCQAGLFHVPMPFRVISRDRPSDLQIESIDAVIRYMVWLANVRDVNTDSAFLRFYMINQGAALGIFLNAIFTHDDYLIDVLWPHVFITGNPQTAQHLALFAFFCGSTHFFERYRAERDDALAWKDFFVLFSKKYQQTQLRNFAHYFKCIFVLFPDFTQTVLIAIDEEYERLTSAGPGTSVSIDHILITLQFFNNIMRSTKWHQNERPNLLEILEEGDVGKLSTAPLSLLRATKHRLLPLFNWDQFEVILYFHGFMKTQHLDATRDPVDYFDYYQMATSFVALMLSALLPFDDRLALENVRMDHASDRFEPLFFAFEEAFREWLSRRKTFDTIQFNASESVERISQSPLFGNLK